MSTSAPQLTIEEIDKENFLHPFTPIAAMHENGPKVMVEGDGILIKDNKGNEYIDAMAGLWCVNIGWGREEMVEAIAEQARKLPYYHTFAGVGNEPAALLAQKIKEHTPSHMSKIFFGNSGSDANDTNVKIVWYYNNLRGKPEKKKIISRWRAYHGVTVAAASLTGLEYVHKKFDVPLPQIHHVSAPHFYRSAESGMSEQAFVQKMAQELEALILAEGPESVAAFIAEPIQGAGGVIVPPDGYFEAVQAVLKKYDVLLIADEVICGFGRCGTWFGSQYFNIQPDIMTVAKGLTSGYIPMSGSLISEDIYDVFLETSPEVGSFSHGFTYSAHPIAAAAGIKNIEIMERENLIGNAATVGAYFQEQLRAHFSDHPLVGEVRGVGLVAAVELSNDKTNKGQFSLEDGVGARLAQLALGEGLIARALPLATAISFSPPLIVTRADCDEIIARFGRALDTLTGQLKQEGLFK